MKVLLDMNLSPDWVSVLELEGFVAVHWSKIGDYGALDRDVLKWADENDHILVTHDLDFGSLLAAGAGSGPSVVQIRVQDITPAGSDQLLIDTLRRFERELKEGVLISVDTMRSRVRILPLR